VASDVSKGFQDDVTVFDSDRVLQLVTRWLATVIAHDDDAERNRTP
jgi:hypothetical protein